MRVACLFDIHGNITALEAVHEDLRRESPDLVLHGGDLADTGSSPFAVVDRIRSLGWAGVMGNTDQMLVAPESLIAFAKTSAAPPAMWDLIASAAAHTRAALGDENLNWMRRLPMVLKLEDHALVHASPEDCWRAPGLNASQDELALVYCPLAARLVVVGHTHLPGVRYLSAAPNTLVNAGSVGLPYDGDTRASYLLLDDGKPTIKRVAYDVEREVELLRQSGSPIADWTARMLRSGTPQSP